MKLSRVFPGQEHTHPGYDFQMVSGSALSAGTLHTSAASLPKTRTLGHEENLRKCRAVCAERIFQRYDSKILFYLPQKIYLEGYEAKQFLMALKS